MRCKMKGSNVSVGVLRKRIESKVKRLSASGPVMEGTLSEILVRCGNPNCRCARGEKHSSQILTSKVKRKTKTVYVPVGMVKEVKEWIQERRRLQKLIKEISADGESIIRMSVKTNRAVSRNRKMSGL